MFLLDSLESTDIQPFQESLHSFYDFLKWFLGEFPPGYEWVYIFIMLVLGISVVSAFNSIFSRN